MPLKSGKTKLLYLKCRIICWSKEIISRIILIINARIKNLKVNFEKSSQNRQENKESQGFEIEFNYSRFYNLVNFITVVITPS